MICGAEYKNCVRNIDTVWTVMFLILANIVIFKKYGHDLSGLIRSKLIEVHLPAWKGECDAEEGIYPRTDCRQATAN